MMLTKPLTLLPPMRFGKKQRVFTLRLRRIRIFRRGHIQNISDFIRFFAVAPDCRKRTVFHVQRIDFTQPFAALFILPPHLYRPAHHLQGRQPQAHPGLSGTHGCRPHHVSRAEPRDRRVHRLYAGQRAVRCGKPSRQDVRRLHDQPAQLQGTLHLCRHLLHHLLHLLKLLNKSIDFTYVNACSLSNSILS